LPEWPIISVVRIPVITILIIYSVVSKTDYLWSALMIACVMLQGVSSP
jgi:hypothetical protein